MTLPEIRYRIAVAGYERTIDEIEELVGAMIEVGALVVDNEGRYHAPWCPCGQ